MPSPMVKKTPLLLLPCLALLLGCESRGPSRAGPEAGSPLEGPYLGQTPPGPTPELFAPGVVTTGMYTRDVAMTPDGSELYFGVLLGTIAAIIEVRQDENGVWGEPEVAPFSQDSRFFNLEPHVTPDGSRLLFLSTRVEDPAEEDLRNWTNQDIWAVDRQGDGWGEPYSLGAPVNTADAEFFPSMTLHGTLYFTRSPAGGQESYIYRSRFVGGAFQAAEKLGPEVNSTPSQFNAFIAPDESYLILCTAGRDDSLGGTDYYVVFRDENDRWSEPINLGEQVNSPGDGEFSPYVSPDGRFFFFMSTRRFSPDRLPVTLTWDYLKSFRSMPETGNAGIYWMDAGFIEELRPGRHQE